MDTLRHHPVDVKIWTKCPCSFVLICPFQIYVCHPRNLIKTYKSKTPLESQQWTATSVLLAHSKPLFKVRNRRPHPSPSPSVCWTVSQAHGVRDQTWTGDCKWITHEIFQWNLLWQWSSSLFVGWLFLGSRLSPILKSNRENCVQCSHVKESQLHTRLQTNTVLLFYLPS